VAKTTKSSEAVKTVRLARDLRVAGAAAAFASLRELAVAGGSRIALDAGQVEKVDAAGLQALVAARRLLADSGKTVSWSGCSAPLRSAAELLGLAEPLGLQ